MKIGIYGKQDETNAEVLYAFQAGCIALELQPVWRAPRNDSFRDFDAACVLGLRRDRKMVRDAFKELGLPVFVIEYGHLLREQNVWQIGLDVLNWLPEKECPSDRFESFGLALEECPDNARDFLVVGQKPGDAQHGLEEAELSREIQRMVLAIREAFDPRIVYKPHPAAGVNQFIPTGIDALADDAMDHIWPDIGTVVTYNSNMGNLALLKGRKVICNEKAQYAPVASGAMTREQYFARLAYTNWHIDEIGEGKFLPFYLDVIAGEDDAVNAGSDA